MPTSAPPPTLDDLCAAMARFRTCLERADLDTLVELHDRVSATRSRSHRVAYLIQAKIDAKARRGRQALDRSRPA